MLEKDPPNINIALVGGGTYCEEFLKKSALDYRSKAVKANIVVVADTDADSPGITLAEELGIITVTDYHEIYRSDYNIHLITVLTPNPQVLEDILSTKPSNIRLISYETFELFWDTIQLEEQKLRIRNKEMATILDGIQDFILVITPEREIIDVNESFLKQMNYSRENVLGRKCYEVFKEVTRKSSNCDLVCPLNETMRNRKPRQRILTRLGYDDKSRYSELTIFPIWGKDGTITKFIEISRDITKRKTEEEENTKRLEKMVEERTHQLEETHKKLLHQDKMASLGKLSASVVHEINNPIAGILNLTLLIKRIVDEGTINSKELNQFNNYLDLMENETRRISRIVSNLLAFSRQSDMELQKVNINGLIEKSLLLNSNLLKINNVQAKVILDPVLPAYTGSEDKLQQVFMNFISNAAESLATIGGGVFSVETKHSLSDNSIVIRIKDSGPGIPQENLPRLFEPFFTTKKKSKGVGLGLSVVYGIIEEHRGSLYVNSKEGKGSTFKITLPLRRSPLMINQNSGL